MKSFAVLLAVALYWQANLVASQDDPIEDKGVASGEAPASVRTNINAYLGLLRSWLHYFLM